MQASYHHPRHYIAWIMYAKVDARISNHYCPCQHEQSHIHPAETAGYKHGKCARVGCMTGREAESATSVAVYNVYGSRNGIVRIGWTQALH